MRDTIFGVVLGLLALVMSATGSYIGYAQGYAQGPLDGRKQVSQCYSTGVQRGHEQLAYQDFLFDGDLSPDPAEEARLSQEPQECRP